MTTDTLDQLTDAELSECFAVEVAGWSGAFTAFAWHDRAQKKHPMRFLSTKPGGGMGDYSAFIREDGVKLCCGVPHGVHRIPPFATDANAVLPWLEKWGTFTMDRNLATSGYLVQLWVDHPGYGPECSCPEPPSIQPEYYGRGQTFPRAACIALILAQRAKKATP